MSRNPYPADDGKPVLRQSVFVFMDILGYSEMIRDAEKEDTQQEFLERLHRALTAGRSWLENKEISSELKIRSRKDRFALKAFTDNIVIVWPVQDDAESEFGDAFFKLTSFQFQMVLEGFFVRGALSLGDAYVDEIAVFGSALLEAHDGESKLARDPRIILTRSAVETVKKHLAYYGNPRQAPQVRDLLRDSDGQWFLNYLDCVLIAVREQGPFFKELLRHKAIVEQQLILNKDKPTIWSKYAWVAGYHNYFCSLHPHFFSEEHKIDLELFRASPSLITA